jgi:DNA-binding NarL/FixJ family response regulator
MAQPKQIRLLIADDHPVVRRGLMSVLSSYPELNVIGGVATGTAALAALEQSNIDVLLLDLRMPEMNGLETLRAIRESGFRVSVIVLTSFETDEDIYQAIVLGADGYLLKASPDEEILAAIQSVVSGERFFLPSILSRFAELMPRAGFSSLQASIVELLEGGLKFEEIATRLHVSIEDVKSSFDSAIAHLFLNESDATNSSNANKVTIDEIARKAGVSMSTVSRVLHNKGNHTEQTRSAVMRVVREHGFQLNHTAASLAMRRSK